VATPGTAYRSLALRRSPLAVPSAQVAHLEGDTATPAFARTLAERGLPPLAAAGIEVLQVNLGKICNQTCRHCHVDAGPDRTESMATETLDACLAALAGSDIPTLDITGGAPELHPEFRRLVAAARRLRRHVMDRCNLTVLLLRGQEDLVPFLAGHQVEIVASLPYFRQTETDAQRGEGVFGRSIEALRRLNAAGYGREGAGLILNLVTNPVGAYLPAPQAALERDWHRELQRRHGIVFNHLYTITNMPISRFLDHLLASGNYAGYMRRLVEAFNPAAVPGVMCRSTLSVGWDGRLFDCDFNQMLDLEVGSDDAGRLPSHIRDFDGERLARRDVVTGRHCFGCTAGGGSSCGGALT